MMNSVSAKEPQRRYDVFLSFRGEDTRSAFTGNLYNALHKKGINTFIDNEELKIGDQLSSSLLNAIEQSRISIIVLSENYASSTWCLEELSKILECMETKKQLVWPIFYTVAPRDVRYQRNRYGEAMAAHEDRFSNDTKKVLKWRSALSEVASLKGWEWHPKTGYEHELTDEIVQMAATKLHSKKLHVGEHVIGLQSRIVEVKLLFDIESCNEGVCMLGIHGTGGVGKTTLAKALYNSIVDDGFQCTAFIESVRERSNGYNNMLQLQEKLLHQLLEDKHIMLSSVDEGAERIKKALCLRKVLLVLDDVDKQEQLEKLAGGCDWFGSGSSIIITTRDKHLLKAHKIEKSYEMKLLNDHEALELFCWNAFTMSQPKTTYKDVSNRAVRYAKGLPLALKVIGSNLISKSVEECESALKLYGRTPEGKIQQILKVSYDCLEENAKNIFLDIACFFKGESLEYVEKILEACDFGPKYNIGVLVDKSLLTIEHGHLRMHDLIQDMGRAIVRQDAASIPGKHSRLCFHEDVLTVLTENSGSRKIEGIMLDLPEQEEVEWDGDAFKKMNNLRILIIRNARFSIGPNYLPNSLRLLEWKHYPSESLPQGFNPRKIVVLNLPNSCLKLVKPLQKNCHLVYLNFSDCKFLSNVPDMSGVPCLRELRLRGCDNLIGVHESVGYLKHLVVLDASDCPRLIHFLPKMSLPCLRSLELYSCSSLEHLPDIDGEMKELSEIAISYTGIKELPPSILNLPEHLSIDAGYCTGLDIPCSFFMSPIVIYSLELDGNAQVRGSFRRFQSSNLVATSCCNLRNLHFCGGGLSDEDLHAILKCFPNLEELIVEENDFVSLPASIKEFVSLRTLDVGRCMKLQEILELPSNIQKIVAYHCPLLSETSMLWSQASKEVCGLEVVMPKTEIPDWFDHRCRKDTLSFWYHHKFPVVAIAFVLKKEIEEWALPNPYLVWIRLYINGLKYALGSNHSLYYVPGDHVLLFDLHALIRHTYGERRIVPRPLEREWNHVEVKCECSDRKSYVSECGAYVYKQQTNMDDIQFNCPNQLVKMS